jgi:hypothetical protein
LNAGDPTGQGAPGAAARDGPAPRQAMTV